MAVYPTRESDDFQALLDRMERYRDDNPLERGYYAAMRHNGIATRAEKAGRTFQEQEVLEEESGKIRRLVRDLLSIVDPETQCEGLEVEEERAERIDALLAAQPRGPVPPGMKRPCRHNRTQKAVGWTPHWDWDKRGWFRCTRCGAEAGPLPARTEPTWAVKRTRQILLDTFGGRTWEEAVEKADFLMERVNPSELLRWDREEAKVVVGAKPPGNGPKIYKVGLVTVEWNGSATFNVFYRGKAIDVFTVYGTRDGKDGYACTVAEADKAVEDWKAEFPAY